MASTLLAVELDPAFSYGPWLTFEFSGSDMSSIRANRPGIMLSIRLLYGARFPR